ncbi:AcrR family transcriptional regulator [Saccharothrix tamanrassetensis]|uniref:AcrR family transcriptional regulator n=1 Tax=Saccharothrix tamanrassetensis TaxID=1051531 RepID=A0A841CIA8_9PSEU|nr:TetR/AcrR family transcriptional regulator [Saccharothrix tamanrassetensis]MBB5956750.1 AcrR family transcriptional regulator [Saccharothrix tamanrassetensis]
MDSDSSGPQSGSSKIPIDISFPTVPVEVSLPLRADAVRNRAKVLEAAGRLFAERGVESVTMDDVAAAAGVGKGTLYRHFGDKSGLATALLDQRETELQKGILSGRPPLGPGMGPADRLVAFTTAYLGFLRESLDIVLLSQTSTTGARFRPGAHAFWRRHCSYLLEQCRAPEPDIAADVLLAALSAEQVQHWLVDQGLPFDRLSAALVQVTRSLTA